MNSSGKWDWQARYEDRDPSDDLRQGDIVLVKDTPLQEYFNSADHFVILNQSCDLARQKPMGEPPIHVSKARMLVVAPAVDVAYFFSEQIERGRELHNIDRFCHALWWNHSLYAYLPPLNGSPIDRDLLIVLEVFYTLELWKEDENGAPDMGRYDEIARAPRVGLLSPWAERLGWMVCRIFGRVATPDPDSSIRQNLKEEICRRIVGEN